MRGRAWTEREDKYIYAQVYRESYEDIAKALGRTPAAVRQRRMQLCIPTAAKYQGFVTAVQAAKMLDVTVSTVYRFIKNGQLQAEKVRVGKRDYHVISKIDIDELMKTYEKPLRVYWTTKEVEQIFELIKKGNSYKAIADIMGKDYNRVVSCIRRVRERKGKNEQLL